MYSGPSTKEVNDLVDLFSRGHHLEATSRAQAIVARFPQHELSWKVLAAAFMNIGQLADALPAQKNVTTLAPNDANAHNNLGVILKGLGHLSEAEISYRLALQIDENYAEAHSNLGNLLKDLGRLKEAEVSYRWALKVKPNLAVAHNNLGNTLQLLGSFEEAKACYQRALHIKPDYAEAHNNMGNTLKCMGRTDEADASFRRAIEIKPDYFDTYINRASLLQDIGRHNEAVGCYKGALEVSPFDAAAHFGLGMIYAELGQLDQADASCRRALQINPSNAEWHSNFGTLLMRLGRVDEGIVSYRRALQIDPKLVDALNNLAMALIGQGKLSPALVAIRQSLGIKETGLAKSIFVRCVKELQIEQCDDEIEASLVHALVEPWGRPNDLARVAIQFVKIKPDIKECIERASFAWPQRLSAMDLFGVDGLHGLAPLAADPLLCALLNSALICDLDMECFLTSVRRVVLQTLVEMPASHQWAESEIDFCCALARQCFLNEYVFSITAEELRSVEKLRTSLEAALASGVSVPISWPMMLAAYVPLGSLANVSSLLDTQWPDAMKAVLAQQVREPQEESQLRLSIPHLTEINDEVSLLVQIQYEENPYPRWSGMARQDWSTTVEETIRSKFPMATFQHSAESGAVDILIAGCGTGQHAIDTAQQYLSARVLAIDLSLNSLGYAKRKTCEFGLNSIEYAQADILKLGSLGRSFNVIESVGVLHHMADPWTGWSVLLSLLRPGGVMYLGLYSEIARKNIVRARSFIAEHGFGATASEIRRCRETLMSKDNRDEFKSAISFTDFFSTSACRDLLFHVQEHRLTLDAINAFLAANRLVFLGFEINENIRQAYSRRFPNDRAATNLAQWQIFENETPVIFAGMYQFWIQKAS